MSQSAELTGEWIWGDEETEVYAQGCGADATMIFRFSKIDRRTLLTNRIYFRRAGRFVGRKVRHARHALCFSVPESPTQIDVVHTLPDGRQHDAATFGDGGDGRGFLSKEVMCEHLWAAVAEVWPGVCKSPALKDSAAVVDIDCLDGEQVTWNVIQHPGYSRFLQCLHEGEGDQEWLGKVSSIVKFEALVRYEGLGGRVCATKVLMGGFRRDYFAFKGIDFRTFLAQKDGPEDSTVKFLIKTWHQSSNVVAIMPPHPNILQPSTTAVTIGSSSGEDRVICGCLYRYMPNGDVGSSLEKALQQHTRLPLETKKKCCLQMWKQSTTRTAWLTRITGTSSPATSLSTMMEISSSSTGSNPTLQRRLSLQRQTAPRTLKKSFTQPAKLLRLSTPNIPAPSGGM